jgi:2-methylfumaryl-CoA hydratase
MVRKRDATRATRYLDAPVIPNLPAQVEVADLPEFPGPLPTTRETGGRFFFEDYVPGERIYPREGMTVDHADHASYTRLFQNSAKVHFDVLLTGGERLVMGGFPMSVAYAQAFNGLENRSGIVAMNGGTHANPCYAGMTIYSYSEVLETHPLGDRPYGALRLRLVVVKNGDPADDPSFTPRVKDESGREVYDSRVLLDMDYFELMPKRGA